MGLAETTEELTRRALEEAEELEERVELLTEENVILREENFKLLRKLEEKVEKKEQPKSVDDLLIDFAEFTADFVFKLVEVELNKVIEEAFPETPEAPPPMDYEGQCCGDPSCACAGPIAIG